MRTCIVCKKFSIPGENSRSFHKFPNESALKEKWMLTLRILSVPKCATVCSDHFDENAFHKTDGCTSLKRLLADAIPISPSSIQEHAESSYLIENETISLCTGVCESNVSMEADNGFKDKVSTPDDAAVSNISASIPPDSAGFTEPTLMTHDVCESSQCTSTEFVHSNELCVSTDIVGNSTSRKRKISTDSGQTYAINIKRIRFTDGYETKYFSRSDCVSNEAWERFLRYKIARDKQQENNRKKNHRISKKLRNINEVVNNLKEKESSSAAEYMQVY